MNATTNTIANTTDALATAAYAATVSREHSGVTEYNCYAALLDSCPTNKAYANAILSILEMASQDYYSLVDPVPFGQYAKQRVTNGIRSIASSVLHEHGYKLSVTFGIFSSATADKKISLFHGCSGMIRTAVESDKYLTFGCRIVLASSNLRARGKRNALRRAAKGSGPAASAAQAELDSLPSLPQPASSDPASPQPASSDPASPQPASSDPASPQPASSDPASPQPASSDPAQVFLSALKDMSRKDANKVLFSLVKSAVSCGLVYSSTTAKLSRIFGLSSTKEAATEKVG